MTGICLYSPKKEANRGCIMRVAYNYEVDFVCLINSQYQRMAADTPNAKRHIPTFFYPTVENFLISYPRPCELINLECQNSRPLETFIHPKNAIYCFGPENGSLPEELLKVGINLKIRSSQCLNQAICCANVIFHRHLQFFK